MDKQIFKQFLKHHYHPNMRISKLNSNPSSRKSARKQETPKLRAKTSKKYKKLHRAKIAGTKKQVRTKKIVKSKKTPKTKKKSKTLKSQTPNNTASSSFAEQMLSGHNALRAQHGAKPLTWNADAAAAAQVWAKRCVFEHGGGKAGHFGENIAAGYSTVAGVIKAWGVDEIPDYHLGVYSHFTQMVWKSTTSVGCAVINCDGILGGGTAPFYVCEYAPAGNVIGQDKANVQV